MKHLLLIALMLLFAATTNAQIDDEAKHFLDSLGIKFDPNDTDAEFKIGNALKALYTAKMDSAMKAVANEVVDPYYTGTLAEEILKDFEEGDDTTSTSYEFMQEMPFILLNLDRPNRRYITESGFELPTSISILIIRGNGSAIPVNFNSLLSRLEYGNIRELYVTNNKGGVSHIPDKIGSLTTLKILGLYGNNISQLPSSIGDLTQLEELYIDGNPIAKLPETLANMKGLKILGIAKTQISSAEQSHIQKLLPNCKILLQ